LLAGSSTLPASKKGNPMTDYKSLLDYSIIAVLGLMSIISLWLFIERCLFYKKVKLSSFTTEEDLKIALSQNLTGISMMAANAPYVGLLGTVFGIMLTFYDIGAGSGIHPEEIMKGLALALKATAAGLFVAIPSVFFYNGLERKSEVLTLKWKALKK
jgi:biopolymer transport protein ExbB